MSDDNGESDAAGVPADRVYRAGDPVLDAGQAVSLLSLQFAYKACAQNGALAAIVAGADWSDAENCVRDFGDLIHDVAPVPTPRSFQTSSLVQEPQSALDLAKRYAMIAAAERAIGNADLDDGC